jgi:hypothetical protein
MAGGSATIFMIGMIGGLGTRWKRIALLLITALVLGGFSFISCSGGGGGRIAVK